MRRHSTLAGLILLFMLFALAPSANARGAVYVMPETIEETRMLASASENMRLIYDFITQEMLLSRAAACGILANIRAESNFNPEAIGDSGNAYGICQWNSRRQSLINYCAENGYGEWTSLEGQLNYMRYELLNNKKSVGNYLTTVSDDAQGAFDAAHYFCVYYEIPGDRYNKGVTRGKNAVNTYWIQFGGTVETYEIAYDANGGQNVPDAQTKTEGVPLTLTSDTPRRQGYNLAGWSERADAKTATYAPGGSFSDNRSLTLYAVWEKALSDDTQPTRTYSEGGHVYEYFEGEFTWEYAESFAQKRGGTLASVRTAREAEIVSELVKDAPGACYLGGVLADGNWTWVSGEHFDDDFAKNYWASGQPAQKYGTSEYRHLLCGKTGEWSAVAGMGGEAAGFVVEYGENDAESFDAYRIVVSSSLKLREGPGTSYTALGSMTPGTLITIREILSVSSGAWGWGVTGDGARGWCAVKIPDYMVRISGVDIETQLAYQVEEDGSITVVEYSGSGETLAIPREIAGSPVKGIASGAFNNAKNLIALTVGDWVTRVSATAFHTGMVVTGGVGSAAHRAAVAAGVSYEMILPEDRSIFPESTLEVSDEAFLGTDIRVADFSVTQLTYIGAGAFKDAINLEAVLLPACVSYIAPNAFDDKPITFVVVPGTYAETWAADAGYSPVHYAGE